MGLPPLLTDAAWLYVAALLCCSTSTAKGALRCLDRYPVLSALTLAAPSVRLAGVGLCLVLQAPAAGYLAAWAGGLLAGHLLLQVVVARTLSMASLAPPFAQLWPPIPASALFSTPCIGNPTWTSSQGEPRCLRWAACSVRKAPASIVWQKDLAEAVDRPVLMLRQAIFPDQSRL